eukprot:gnl/Chilomastix_cuspidata/5075.p1 GENE.gnl/Chilomastix_cuspidata/5075~~gnl/Chilomastix_cuspidata/5075.p1  ORF type:complete len:861 (-),score=321.96 gnl/Chilomastix_cuspidata/5075:608-3190(-)
MDLAEDRAVAALAGDQNTLVLLSEGLGLARIVAKFFKARAAKRDDKCVLILYEKFLQSKMADIFENFIEFGLPTPHYLGTEVIPKKRRQLYADGGVFVTSARSFSNDMLQGALKGRLAGIFLVAPLLTLAKVDSPLLVWLGTFRGTAVFVKGVSDNAGAYVAPHSAGASKPLSFDVVTPRTAIISRLGFDQLHFLPRNHVDVVSALSAPAAAQRHAFRTLTVTRDSLHTKMFDLFSRIYADTAKKLLQVYPVATALSLPRLLHDAVLRSSGQLPFCPELAPQRLVAQLRRDVGKFAAVQLRTMLSVHSFLRMSDWMPAALFFKTLKESFGAGGERPEWFMNHGAGELLRYAFRRCVFLPASRRSPHVTPSAVNELTFRTGPDLEPQTIRIPFYTRETATLLALDGLCRHAVESGDGPVAVIAGLMPQAYTVASFLSEPLFTCHILAALAALHGKSPEILPSEFALLTSLAETLSGKGLTREEVEVAATAKRSNKVSAVPASLVNRVHVIAATDASDLRMQMRHLQPKTVVLLDARVFVARVLELWPTSLSIVRICLDPPGALEAATRHSGANEFRAFSELLSVTTVPAPPQDDLPAREKYIATLCSPDEPEAAPGAAPAERRVIVDSRELGSSTPVFLHALGVQQRVETLQVGDFIVSKDVVIERKNANDLRSSIMSGRLLSQVERMSFYYARPILFIDLNLTLRDAQYRWNRAAAPSAPRPLQGISLSSILVGYSLKAPALRCFWAASPRGFAMGISLIRRGVPGPPESEDFSVPSSAARSPTQVEQKALPKRRRLSAASGASPLAQILLAQLPRVKQPQVDKIVTNFKSFAELARASNEQLTERLGKRLGATIFGFFS